MSATAEMVRESLPPCTAVGRKPMKVELRGPDGDSRTVDVEGSIDMGRECDGIVVDDPAVSRRHARLELHDGTLIVTDLDSSNGTFINNAAITQPTAARRGDVVRIGDTELRLTEQPKARRTPAARRAKATIAPELAGVENEAGVARFRPGAPGADAAPAVAAAARRARRRLAGFGSEPKVDRPELLVLDPFPDPLNPDETITAGTVVEPEANRIWMVATHESPPEPPARALALLFGAVLPAATDLNAMIEGYGLWIAGVEDPIENLRQVELPPLAAAEGELRSAMALSFVHFLVTKDGEGAVRTFLTAARPGQVDEAARDAFGAGFTALELG